MFMGMIIVIYQFYCVQGRVAIPVNGSCYYTIIVRQEKVIYLFILFESYTKVYTYIIM